MIDHLNEPKIDYVFRSSGGYRFSETYKAGEEKYLDDFKPSDHPAIILKGSFIEKKSLIGSLVNSVLYFLLLDENQIPTTDQ